MTEVKSRLTIQQLVTGGPMILLVLMSLVLGFDRYRGEYSAALDHQLELANVTTQPILDLMKRSVSGGNYANVTDAVALNLYKANHKLKFFEVKGNTDRDKEPFGLVYDASSGQAIRSTYAADYAPDLTRKIALAEERLKTLSPKDATRARIQEIADETRADLGAYEASTGIVGKMRGMYNPPDAASLSKGYYLDKKNWQLHLVQAVDNTEDGQIWMVMDVAEIGDLWKVTLWHVLPMNIAVLSLGLLSAWFIARRIAAPMKAMLATMEKVGRDSDLRLRLDLNSKDAYGHTAAAFNGMLENFQNIVQKAAHVAGQVTEASQRMLAVSGKTSESMAEQSDEIAQMAAAIEEMSATVQTVAFNTSKAAEASTDASAQAEQGRHVVGETIASINHLAAEVQKAAGVITKLREESNNIGTVLDVIQSITEQINLLALNAAIEAARAGEHGRGFAVVADEVRALAEKTRHSTQEIHGMIEGFQRGAQEAVSVMEKGCVQAMDCTEQASKAGASLGEIAGAIQTISEMSTQIAAALGEQSTTAENISGMVLTINGVADHTAGDAQNASAASRDLARLAEELQDVVRSFAT